MISQAPETTISLLSAEEQALLNRSGINVQVETQQWLFQVRWNIHLFDRNQVCWHTISGTEAQAIQQLHLLLSAIANGLTQAVQAAEEQQTDFWIESIPQPARNDEDLAMVQEPHPLFEDDLFGDE